MFRGIGSYIRQHHLALIALFVALSGTAYAAATIGADDIKKNAVLSKHIKRGNVKRSDVAANSVNSAKVANNSLGLADIVVAQDTVSLDQAGLLANQCNGINLTSGPFSRVKPGDVTLIFPHTPTTGQVPINTVQLNPGQGARAVLCNTSEGPYDPPLRDFKVIVLR